MKISQIVVNESIELGDNFDIELGNTIIESRVVGFMNDGVVVEADDKALALLGIGGAVLESVVVNEVSLGDYRKKAMLSKGLGAIDTKFGRSPEAQAKGAETVRRREAGLARLDARSEKARAQADAEYKAALPAKYAEKYAGVDIDAEIARLQKELRSATLDYQYGASNTYSAAKQRSDQIAAQLRDLEQAKKILGQQGVAEDNMDEAKYQGRSVPLGKPMQGDVKKFKVYVKNKKGNVVKVNFGDPNMRIKKSNPARRKSFRARHRCATAKDRTSARYWSCRAW